MTARKLSSLTAAQESRLIEIGDRYIHELTNPPPFVETDVIAWLDLVYSLFDQARPARVEYAKSAVAACELATRLTGDPVTVLDWRGVRDGGWLAFSEAFRELGVQTPEEDADAEVLRRFARSAWDTILLEEGGDGEHGSCAIVVLRPAALRVDAAGNLHGPIARGADGAGIAEPCIEWQDGSREYAVHGTWVSERVATAPRSHSREEYEAITNTEERRALGELAGWDWVVDLLGGQVVDTWTDPETQLLYELIDCTAHGQKMLRKQSPRLKDGSQPTYLEPVHEHLRTARAARKWQAVPTWTAEQCEADPVLTYGVEA